MNNEEILEKFRNIRTFREKGKISLHKPILLLYVLAQCHHKKERMLNFYSIDKAFKSLFLNLSINGKYENSHYPFGKLENDGIWEVENSKNLKRTSVGHLSKKELLDENIHGGFIEEIYSSLLTDEKLLKEIFKLILFTYVNENLHKKVLTSLNININI